MLAKTSSPFCSCLSTCTKQLILFTWLCWVLALKKKKKLCIHDWVWWITSAVLARWRLHGKTLSQKQKQKTEKRLFLEQFVELPYLVLKCCPRQPAAWKVNYVLRIKCLCESLSCSFQVPRPMPWDSRIFGWPSSWPSQCAYCLLSPSASYQWPSGHQKAIRYIKIQTWSPPTWVPFPGTKAFPNPTFPADFSVHGTSDQNFIVLLYLFNSILKDSEPSRTCPYSVACFAPFVLRLS